MVPFVSFPDSRGFDLFGWSLTSGFNTNICSSKRPLLIATTRQLLHVDHFAVGSDLLPTYILNSIFVPSLRKHSTRMSQSDFMPTKEEGKVRLCARKRRGLIRGGATQKNRCTKRQRRRLTTKNKRSENSMEAAAPNTAHELRSSWEPKRIMARLNKLRT